MHESGEDYLKTIYILYKKSGYVRSIDIANSLGYSRPSVSRAMSILENDGYITRGDAGEIKLTDEGFEMARDIYEKHGIISEFLIKTTGIDEDTAIKDAHRIEHILSPSTYEGIKRYLGEAGTDAQGGGDE